MCSSFSSCLASLIALTAMLWNFSSCCGTPCARAPLICSKAMLTGVTAELETVGLIFVYKWGCRPLREKNDHSAGTQC